MLYALSATNLMMLLALVFVLARNIIKLLVERRRAIPFVRFRAKLVFILLGMTLIPAVLVLIVGSNVVHARGRSMVQRAGRGDSLVGEPDCRRLLPRAAAGGHRSGRRGLPGLLAAADLASPMSAPSARS